MEPETVFMGMAIQDHALARQVISPDSEKLLMTARKPSIQGNPQGLSSSFLLAANKRASRSLLYDWWRQVDDFPDKKTIGGVRYSHFRNSGLREESVLTELIAQG